MYPLYKGKKIRLLHYKCNSHRSLIQNIAHIKQSICLFIGQCAEVLCLHMMSKHGEPMVGFPDYVKDEYSKKLGEAGYFVLIEQAFEINPPKQKESLISKVSEVDETAPDVSADDDTPLFTDDSIIEEIQRNENASDNRPFWETPDIQGEQLSIFGDSEPLVSNNSAKQKYKSEFAA